MKNPLAFQSILAVLLTVAGLVLLFIGVLLSPPGEIHYSILVAFGEVCTFAGALAGIHAKQNGITPGLPGEKEKNRGTFQLTRKHTDHDLYERDENSRRA